jgi:hypothetical protein
MGFMRQRPADRVSRSVNGNKADGREFQELSTTNIHALLRGVMRAVRPLA